MFIDYAFAQDVAADAPQTGEMFLMNFLLIGVLIVLMYVLMIRPQQRRIKEHKDMIGSLKKGERVVTNGGLVGEIDDNTNQNEVVLKIGDKNKVTVLRSAISGRYEDIVRGGEVSQPAKDDAKNSCDVSCECNDNKDDKKSNKNSD